MQTQRIRAARTARSGISGLWLVLGILVLVLLAGGGCAVSTYNGIVQHEASVDAQWSEIGNQYKRRFDLIPQLVETVKGAANFEKSTIVEVTEARASVGKIQLGGNGPVDPAAMKQFIAAQDKLGSSLSRLLVTVEKYPDLKASNNFLTLQSQLEGTENRIGVARRDYIDSVKVYNTSIRKFPATLLASSFGFESKPQLEFDAESTSLPEVKFDFGSKSDGNQ